MKVKYTSSKWFLENNGEWIEIVEKDWEKVKIEVWDTQGDAGRISNWQPTPDTEYQLPDDVGFEIEWYRALKAGDYEWELREGALNDSDEDKMFYVYMKIAHLKVEQIKQINEDFLGTHDEIIKYNQTYGKQEQSEVERLREEVKFVKNDNVTLFVLCEQKDNELETLRKELSRNLISKQVRIDLEEKLSYERSLNTQYQEKSYKQENEIEFLSAKIRELESKVSQLQAFKVYVHKRLDDAGIEKDPESPHKEAGCRIGGRLDLVFRPIAQGRRTGLKFRFHILYS